MAVETASDVAQYFDTDTFGVAATYTPDGGSGSTVNVILNRQFVEVEAGGTVGVESQAPVITVAVASAPNLAQNDTFVISSTTYTVVGVELDLTETIATALCRT